AFGVMVDSGLSDNNSEDMIFSFAGGGGIAGAFAALGIGVADQTQHPNDMVWFDLPTKGGSYGIIKVNGGNQAFVNYYDRSNPSVATIWHHGGSRITLISGEDQNTTGLSHLIDVSASQTILINRTVTQSGAATTTCNITAGSLILRGSGQANTAQTWTVSGTGIVDFSDPAWGAANVTVSGSAGTLLLAGNYAGAGTPPIVSSWTGATAY